MRRPLVVFWVPGFGLGRLVRAMAIARRLETRHLIYASATAYTEIARRQGFHVRNCCVGAIEDIAKMKPAAIVTDTWPYDRKRKLAAIPCKHVFIARKCNDQHRWPMGIDAVLDPQDRYILIRDRAEWSLEKGQKVLGNDKPVLAFHAGIHRKEREHVFTEAARVADELGKPLVCMTPKQYFPICELLPAAGHVICAAGYNSFAETQCWGGPTTYIPMGRTYDDQEGRLIEKPKHFDGAIRAAQTIHDLIGGGK